MRTENRRIETKLEIKSYIDKYALLNNDVIINIQSNREVDSKRREVYTNKYTIANLFPDEDVKESLAKELAKLLVEEYVETLKDIKFPNKSEMRVFGRKYSNDYVYIKIRMNLIDTQEAYGQNYLFVMSFYFAEREFKNSDFPYRKC